MQVILPANVPSMGKILWEDLTGIIFQSDVIDGFHCIENQIESAVADFVRLRSELKDYCWKSRGTTCPSAP